MRFVWLLLAFSLVTILGQPLQAKRGGGAPATPLIVSTLESTIVVVGKVTTIEKELVEVTRYEGASTKDPKVGYQTATIKVSESLLGAKGASTIKIGFPASSGVVVGSFDLGKRDLFFNIGLGVTEGQEGIFLLKRHWDGDFYTFANRGFYQPVLYEKKDKDFEKDLTEVKRILSILKDPITALKAKDSEARVSAVDILGQRYRQWSSSKPSTEENLPAEESKLILQVMLEMPWGVLPTDLKGDPNRCLEHCFNVWLPKDQATLKFTYPPLPSDATPEEIHKIYKQAVTKFVNDNKDKIVLKKYVEKK